MSKEMSPKGTMLANFESLCCKIDVNIFYSVQKGESFFRIVGIVEQIVRTSLNFTFSTITEGVEAILKTVFELVLSKII